MIVVRTIVTSTFIALFLMGNVNTYANLAPQNLQTILINTTFEVIVDGVKYVIPTPLTPSSAPVTVKIVQNGNIIFQGISRNTSMVVSDIIEHRLHGDTIEHRIGSGIGYEISENSIEHARIEISQNGAVLFNKEI